jgi:thiol-disulfide isomerase/thioredoxin
MKNLIIVFILFFGSLNQALAEEINTKKLVFDRGFISMPSQMRKAVDKDSNTLTYFFDFNCVYCQAVHPFISTWSDTIPKPYKVSFLPIVNGDPLFSINAAAWNYVYTSDLSEADKYKYLTLMFKYIHKVGDQRGLYRLIKEIFQSINLDFEPFQKKIINEEYLPFLTKQLELQQNIHISATPTIMYGNSLLTDITFVDGDSKKFITLINAVMNVYIYQEKDNEKASEK